MLEATSQSAVPQLLLSYLNFPSVNEEEKDQVSARKELAHANQPKVDPVDEVANDPDKMKKLLEKLMIKSVANGDTSVMEEIIRDVNRAEKQVAR